MIPWLYILVLLLLSFWAGLRIYHRGYNNEPVYRIGASLLPSLLTITALVYYCIWVSMPSIPWNAARLAVSVAFAKGYQLYYTSNEGPILSLIAGPVTPLVFLPSAIASSPQGVLFIGGFINLLLILAPLLVLHWVPIDRTPKASVGKWLGFLFSAAIILLTDDFYFTTSFLHSDQPAFGLGLLSCVALLMYLRRRKHKYIVTAALLATLAVYAKQVIIMLIPAQLVYLVLAAGWREFRQYFLWLLCLGLVASTLFIFVFGVGPMWFNMFVVPYNHPWEGDFWMFVARWAEANINLSVPWMIGLMAVLVSVGSYRKEISVKNSWWVENPWLFLFLIALFLQPIGALAMIKKGGGHNSYHTYYFAIAGAGLVISAAFDWDRWPEFQRIIRQFCLITTAITVFLAGIMVWTMMRMPPIPGRCHEQEAWEMALNYPNEIYFPWNTLACLLADGKLYHFDYGVLDRDLAGFRPSAKHVHQGLPSRMRWVLYPSNSMTRFMLRLLPEFKLTRRLPGDWDVFERESDRGS